MENDINSSIPISPSDFLTLNPRIFWPTPEVNTTDPDYLPRSNPGTQVLQSWKKGERRLDQFWNRWKHEYLTSLRERSQTVLKGPRAQSAWERQQNDAVLIKDDLPRSSWRMGKIKSLIVSRDGLHRATTVQLPSQKTINRPLCLLYPIECPAPISQDMPTSHVGEEPMDGVTISPTKTTKPVRKAAAVAKKRISSQLK